MMESRETMMTDGPLQDTQSPSATEASPIAELEAKAAALEDSLLRAKADYQNLQRRAATERAEAVRYANADLVKALLTAVDDLERTLAAVTPEESESPLVAGVRLALENFLKALREHGVETIDALHQRFDPLIHNAIMQQPSQEHAPGVVIQQAARGFRLRDRVLRPAMVVVSKGSDE